MLLTVLSVHDTFLFIEAKIAYSVIYDLFL